MSGPAAEIFLSEEAAMRVLGEDPKGREVVRTVQELLELHRVSPSSAATPPHPVVVLEGADGVGKSTLVQNLREALGGGAALTSPPEELLGFRAYFDKQRPELRRSYYMACNYACALRMCRLAAEGPVVVDRFWPSTIAYALACDRGWPSPSEMPELLRMPQDLLRLLPRPTLFLLLELPEDERARRVRSRAGARGGPAVTTEEEKLERSRALRERLQSVYGKLLLDGDGQRVEVLPASGTAGEVCARALELVQGRMRRVPVSVNWHYTRQCNYACRFCFHTAKTSFFLPATEQGMAEAKACLKKLRQAGMQKLNFSGGEPFLHPKELGELCRFLKEELRLESVSIVSNGSMVRRSWFKSYSQYLDIIAISCDSFEEETNKRIGRGKGNHLPKLEQIKAWCDEFDVLFKINSVICIENVDEDMTVAIERLKPVRWKVFQCLMLEGENSGNDALRDAEDLQVTKEQFDGFVRRHSALGCLVPESNESMKDSYLILDEHMRFLNCTAGGKEPGKSLRDVPVDVALSNAGFDDLMFERRGGFYADIWSRTRTPPVVEIEAIAGDSSPKRDHKPPSQRARAQGTSTTPWVLGVVVLAGGVAAALLHNLGRAPRGQR